MTFSADHRFSAELVDQAAFFIGCPDLSGSGIWQFPRRESGAGLGLTSDATGSDVVLLFTSPVSHLCSNVVTLTSWEIRPPVGLCLKFDPDNPCTGTPFTKRAQP
jgi:hypothetical protein